MTITLYQTTDDPRKYRKSLTTIAAGITCKPSEPFSVLAPNILVNYVPEYASVNYAYIPELQRYYFCELTLQTGRELLLNCNVDVLMSYDLDNIDVMCVRSESAGINYYPDKQLPVDPARCFVEGILFPQQPLNDDGGLLLREDYIITVNGGAAV